MEVREATGDSGKSNETTDKPVFSARETALFVGGKWVDTLNSNETFALASVLSKLRLASYTLQDGANACTLNIRKNAPSIKLQTGNESPFTLQVKLNCTAGILDYSKSQPIDKIGDAGDIPKDCFAMAEKKLAEEIEGVYEKCKAVKCDLFGVRERLVKYGKRRFRTQYPKQRQRC